jgi:tetratricopeptide (TPR) repeat protein
MRTFAALTLFVSLTNVCYAEDWLPVHNKGVAAVGRRDFQAAAELFRTSIDLARRDGQRASSLSDLGIVLHDLGHESEARPLLRQALAIRTNLPDEVDNYAQTAGALAIVERVMGEYTEAEALLRNALARMGLNDGSLSLLLSTLGDILREQGRFTEARVLLERAANLTGSSWTDRVNTGISLAELDSDTRNWDAGEKEWKDAAALAAAHNFPVAEAVCIRGLGQTWLARRDLARAEPLLKSALARFENDPVRDDVQVANTLTSLGELYLAEGKTGMAEEALGRALEKDERTLGSTHPQVALVLQVLAESFAVRNQAELARNYLDRAEKIMEARFGEQSAMTASVFANWGSIERRLNHFDRAAVQFRKALGMLGTNGAQGDSLRYDIVTQYAEVLKATHHKREAAELLAEAKSFR